MNPAKRKTIKKVLRAKIIDWCETLPNDLVKLAREDAIVTGGAIVSLLRGEPINDFDVYFRTQKTAVAFAEYYAKHRRNVHAVQVRIEEATNIRGEQETRVINYVKSGGISGTNPDEVDESQEWVDGEPPNEPEPEERYRPVFISRNAITLSHSLQLITRFYGDIEAIHRSFDFIHATCSYDYAENTLTLPAEALESILSNTLYYQGSLYPIASIFRAKKFIERGWRISAGELLKIMWQISELDLTDYKLLIDQLTGVDALYMSALIDALEGMDPKHINSSYMIAVIDRIFN